jgi:hypothetical protein
MTRKQRLTVTVDPDLVAAGNRSVADGSAASLSAWVSQALADRARKDRLLEAMGAAIAGYEADFGEITAAEMRDVLRHDRESATVVRGRNSARTRGTPRTRRVRAS